jgi:aryl-alcohol dehydrogenase-like predicted oxidoreductase
MGMSAFYGPRDDDESTKVIDRALELGVTLLDTADMYGPHTNEILVGQAIKGKRDKVVLATKFAITMVNGQRGINGKPEYVRQACDASLKRLGVDHIDLYYQHRVDPETPIEDTIGAMAGLVKAGKVRHVGGVERDDPARSQGPSDHRAAERVLAVDARPRGRRAAGVSRARHRVRRVQPARARLSDRQVQVAR